ncbi:major facilitator family transporter [Legionella geestiana]|uniref:Lysosomal dipeptide transporter MFSD1 n=1 Tax=Legionella geestiana TaxID=45065 RepID=A0A0W0TT20_9GAMM|nr:MFS transporter [Legionella geestiana]KTC98788.1 major facilitator family transporter [Legionella geestiana]STX54729.1 major facilitator family transporter [Legionella geestiana]
MSDLLVAQSRAHVPSRPLLAWITCLSAGLFFFYEFFQLNVFDVINEPLRRDFNLDASAISWLSSTYLWADILFLLPAGVILDRLSTRTVILFSMLVCIIGTFGFGLSHSFYLAAFFHFLSGIGNAFCFLSCIVLVSRWFEPARQGLVVGCLVTMAFLGGMMAHTPFAWLNTQFGWRQAMALDGVLGILLFGWIYLSVKDSPNGRVSPKNRSVPLLPQLVSVIQNRQNWLAGIYTTCLNLPVMVLCALWGASYLQAAHGLGEMTASNVVSLIFTGSLIGCPLAGWLSDTMGRRKTVMLLGGVASLLVMLPLLIPGVLPQTVLSVLFFATGLFTSTQVITYPLVAESNPEHSVGAANAVASVLIMGGAGVAQVLFGALMQFHAGAGVLNYSPESYRFAMWMFPAAIALALLALAFIRETWCRNTATPITNPVPEPLP